MPKRVFPFIHGLLFSSNVLNFAFKWTWIIERPWNEISLYKLTLKIERQKNSELPQYNNVNLIPFPRFQQWRQVSIFGFWNYAQSRIFPELRMTQPPKEKGALYPISSVWEVSVSDHFFLTGTRDAAGFNSSSKAIITNAQAYYFWLLPISSINEIKIFNCFFA